MKNWTLAIIAALVIVAAVLIYKYKDSFSQIVGTVPSDKVPLPPVKNADAPPVSNTKIYKKESGPGLAAIEKRVEEILNSDERASAFLEAGISRVSVFKGLETDYDLKARSAFDYANGTSNMTLVNWPVGAKWQTVKIWLAQIENWKNQAEDDNWKNVKNLEVSLDGLKEVAPLFPFIKNRGDEIKFGLNSLDYNKKMDDGEFRAHLNMLKPAVVKLAARINETCLKINNFLKTKAVADLEKAGWVFA